MIQCKHYDTTTFVLKETISEVWRKLKDKLEFEVRISVGKNVEHLVHIKVYNNFWGIFNDL